MWLYTYDNIHHSGVYCVSGWATTGVRRTGDCMPYKAFMRQAGVAPDNFEKYKLPSLRISDVKISVFTK